ncbi:hypothetical protein MNEG_3525 [Monoraphidium neglectum]|uniref:Glycoside hydrolase family 5 domain-containing protein n=1 Tax=Monoraphidium neglectum TaxID=145388 RepID=A0A0D2MV90_9CHLO|nr:hypothetical protein MNEG_3525 [Monoraphidium neglectum]KIZ04437.1 hypothetical protein MNEG_3525 [Monoraphidium neglectum]|eukprot:XP_013903456.1 hypothetical protein MNEG_3525 [Monoraphidium neglectum]
MRAQLSLALAVGLALTIAGASAKPVELSSSVILFYSSELYPHYGQPISQCELLLNRAKEGGAKSVNIVPTLYWYDPASQKLQTGVCNAEAWAENQVVDHYCDKWEWDSPCEAFSWDKVSRWETGMKDCIKKAHDMFDTVLISPHLDDGTKTMHWRNMLWFDPLKKDKNGFNYFDIMLSPILKAVKASYTQAGKTFIFGAEGEMGGTVFYAPESYLKIFRTIREEYKGPATLKTALMFNHAYLPGVINRGDDVYGAIPEGKFWKKDGGWGPLLPFDQWPEHERLSKALPAIRRLLKSVDVLGVSCYARTSADPQPVELESCAVKYDAELSAMGFDLKAWTNLPGKSFIYNEFALGGGISECGNTPATTREEAGRFSWLGGTSTFTKSIDPWKVNTIQQYNRDWYQAAFKLLKNGGINYKLSGVFLWNVVSWDVQGIHPASSSGEGTFKDEVISQQIREYNAWVAANPNAGKILVASVKPQGKPHGKPNGKHTGRKVLQA